MKQSILIIFILVSVLGPVKEAWAYGQEGLSFAINTFYYTKKDDSQTNGVGSSSESRNLYNDILAGYIFSNSFYFGLLYASDTINYDNGGSSSSDVLSHTGVSGGYKSQDWYFLGHYLLNGTYSLSGGSRWSDGTGYQVDVGYIFPMGSSFGLGPQISYRKIEYKKFETGGTTTSNSKYTRTEMIPALALNFGF